MLDDDGIPDPKIIAERAQQLMEWKPGLAKGAGANRELRSRAAFPRRRRQRGHLGIGAARELTMGALGQTDSGVLIA